MREVSLSRGFVALVDDADYDRVVAAGSWHSFQRKPTSPIYAKKTIKLPGPKYQSLLMHTFITGWPLVDHRDRNGLNNTRANLRPTRPATRLQRRKPVHVSGPPRPLLTTRNPEEPR